MRYLLLLYAALLVYGSWYPFAWGELSAPPFTFLHTLPTYLDKGDVIQNLLVYMPFGLLVVVACGRRLPFAASLLLAAVAGAVYSSRSNGAQPGAGNMFELDAIAACFIGGASTTGGVGRVTGAMVGGLIMAVMSNGMQLMGVDQSVQQIVKGLVLLLAVAFDIFNKRRASVAR